jgi:DNA repair protein RadC
MPLDPVKIVATLEDLRQFYEDNYPAFPELFRRAGELKKVREQPTILLAESMLGALLDLPVWQPAVRRKIALGLRRGLLDQDDAAAFSVQEGSDKESASATTTAFEWLDVKQATDALKGSFPGPLHSKIDRSVRLLADRLQQPVRQAWEGRIDRAKTLPEALGHLAGWFPKHSLRVRCRLLRDMGRACPQPNSQIIKILQRLGWLPTDNPLGITKGSGREENDLQLIRTLEQVARLAAKTPGQVSVLLELLGGLETAARKDGAVSFCVKSPQCRSCPINSHCQFAQLSPDRETAPAPPDTSGTRRELLLAGKIETLTATDLLALCLSGGRDDDEAFQQAQRLWLEHENLATLEGLKKEELLKIKGVGPVRAAALLAAFELGRRTANSRLKRGKQVRDARDIYEAIAPQLRHLKQEVFLMAMLSTKNQIMDIVEVSRGTLNESLVHPRDAFQQAVSRSAGAVIFAHNHPSGDPTPSEADRNTTLRLQEAGRVLKISVLDHVIIGDGCYYSFTDDEIINVTL